MWFAIFGSIKAIFMKKDFDVVYVYQLSPITMTWPAIIVKKMKNIPLIIHVLDQWPISVTTGKISKKSLVYRFLSMCSIDCYNYADLITCSSKSFKNYFINELGISKNKGFAYLPSYAENNYENILKKENDTFDLVFAGNIGPAQSVETIVKAANLLKENKKIKFHIVGDGLSKKKCENLAKNYKLDNIKFYGYHPVEKMSEYYSIADAFLITMVNNEVVNSTLPAKIQSYMIAKKPIIGAISGEVKGVIEEAECGLCCESLDYKTLASLILNASKSSNLETWSNNAYNYYIKHFEKEKCLDDLEKIIKKQLNKKVYKYSSTIEKFIKYAIIGVSCMIIDLLLFTLFNNFIVNLFLKNNIIIVSTICARVISSFINFIFNKNITFDGKGKNTMIKYYVLCIIQMMVSGILVQNLYSKVKIGATLIKLVVDIFIFMVNFYIQKKWIFKEKKDL